MSNVKTILKLCFYPDSVLRKKCEKVKEITPKVKELLREMARVMCNNKGIGLAGPQVGSSKRVITVETGKGLISLVNPKITSIKGSQIGEEGCLSFPGLFVKVKRAQAVEVEGLVLSEAEGEGKLIKIKAQGLLARVFQHEIDHLDGILMIDRLGFLEKLKIRKKLKQLESKKPKI